MATIEIIDSNRARALGLADALSARGYRVRVRPADHRTGIADLLVGEADMVIVDMSLDRADAWETLERLCHGSLGEVRPIVLALADIDRGTGPRLRARRMGCHWINV